MILESKQIPHELIDIAEPGKEPEKEFMQKNSTSLGATSSDANPRNPLPPQFFNGEEYCGDYEGFDLANEIDEVEVFLKLQAPAPPAPAVVAATTTEEATKAGGDATAEHTNGNGVVEEAAVGEDAEKEV